MLFVERSNRTERLLAGLAERLMAPGSAPLVPRTLVVLGQGMERWIAQSIARDYGICANTEFYFPRNLLERVFRVAEEGEPRALGASPGTPALKSASGGTPDLAWEPTQLAWWIARRIAAHPDAPELAPLSRHLEAPDRAWRLVQLAHEIASLFDDYITYRPDWTRRWAAGDSGGDSGGGAGGAARADDASLGPDEAWQSWLFGQLTLDLGPGHLADRAAAFSLRIARGPAARREALFERMRDEFPHGLEVFAVSTLPPLYLSVLDALAQGIDVHLSVLSPSRHYWADLWQEVKDAGAEEPAARRPVAAGAAESLLAGLGRLGSDFQRALENVSGYIETDRNLFEKPAAGGTLLERLQLGLLELEEDSGAPIDPEDRSIQVHLCHGPKRELEVVKAAIRQAFEADATLRPEDVLVMAPQIDTWAPVIDAVFGRVAAAGAGAASATASREDARETQDLPYRIADRGTLRRSPVADAFVGMLGLIRGRATRSELLAWLALEPVRSKFGIPAESVDRLGGWAAEAGIRFGLDESHRSDLDLEPERDHTWAGGIDRGILGHAVGFVPDVFAGLSPVPLPEMVEPALLGALSELEGKLSAARRERMRSRPVDEWAEFLLGLLENLFDRREDNAHEHQLVRGALQSIARAAAQAGFQEPVPFEAMQERFRLAVESTRPAQGFLSGGMTFCELVPLRAIPFRLIAIVGLSDGEFPRRKPAASYDLMAAHPRAGDRNSRTDDRYLFLEALLSARDQLILTVPSKDLRDGADLPPSVVISELLDLLDARFASASFPEGTTLRDRIVFEHPLQSFSARYFDPEDRLSWLALDAESFAGAEARDRVLEAGGGPSRRFFERLSEDEKETQRVREGESIPRLRLEELVDRWLYATRTFARDRLGVRLPRPEESVPDFDPVSLAALEKAQLGAALLADLRSGASREEAAERLIANARLPVGTAGRIEAELLRKEAFDLAAIAAVREAQDGEDQRVVDFPFALELPVDLEALSAESRRPVEWPAELARARRLRLSGLLTGVRESGRLGLSFSRLGGRSEAVFWIEHLVLCALVEAGTFLEAGLRVSPESVLIGRPESKRASEPVVLMRAVPNAREVLARLCALASTGTRAPLPFFPRTSRRFADRVREEKVGQAWRDAHQNFYGGDSDFARAEIEEGLEFQRVWEGTRPLESSKDSALLFSFEDLSLWFFEPLWSCREVRIR